MFSWKNNIGLISLFILLWPSFSKASDEQINGHVYTENATPILNFKITVNGHKSIRGHSGTFRIPFPDQELITLRIDADGFYSSFQTFSAQELKQQRFVGRINPISLVKKKKGRILMAFGGDVMMGRRYYKPRVGENQLLHENNLSNDSKKIVEYVKDYFQIADFASVNLETQIMRDKPKKSAKKSITFFSRPETLEALSWAGVDYVTLGNNHTFDNLEEGLEATLDFLDKSGLGYSGAGRNEDDALKAYHVTLSGQKYSFLGYVGWKGYSKIHQAAEGASKGGAAYGSSENIINTVADQAQESRATIVQYHGGLEYSDGPTLLIEDRLKLAIDYGADLAIGHHPHVVQGFEIYKEKLIAYSLGNFIFDQYFYGPQMTYMLYVWMDGEKFHRAEIIPIYIKGYKPTPAVGHMRQAIIKRVSELSSHNNISFTYSGGHLILNSAGSVNVKEDLEIELNASPNEIIDIRNHAVYSFLKNVRTSHKNKKIRVGKALLNRGDFDQHGLFNSAERGWIQSNARDGITMSKFRNGRGSYQVVVGQNQHISRFGMRQFTRIYKAGNALTFTGNIFAEGNIKVDFYMQRRPKRMSLTKALKEGPKELIGSQNMTGGKWQNFVIDFYSPRVATHSIRVFAEISKIEKSSNDPAHIYFDDVELIEWSDAYGANKGFKNFGTPNQYSHIRIAKEALKSKSTADEKIILKFVNN